MRVEVYGVPGGRGGAQLVVGEERADRLVRAVAVVLTGIDIM